jgi:hypothetical protein
LTTFLASSGTQGDLGEGRGTGGEGHWVPEDAFLALPNFIVLNCEGRHTQCFVDNILAVPKRLIQEIIYRRTPSMHTQNHLNAEKERKEVKMVTDTRISTHIPNLELKHFTAKREGIHFDWG